VKTYEHPPRPHYVLYKCRQCKRTYRKTYQVSHRAIDNEHPEWYLRRTYHEYSIDGGRFSRTETLYYPGLKCDCGNPSLLHGKRIDGRQVDHCPCDKRCTHATGHSCECSCGGANHGSAYQVA
jgi:hypothetical protein